MGDLDLFARRNLDERLFRPALDGSRVGVGDRLGSCFAYLRPMAAIVAATLGRYGVGPYGGRIHDVIGTCCTP